MLKGRHKSFEVVLTRALEVLAILMGGVQKKLSLKRGGARKVLPCPEGVVQKVLDPFPHV